MKSYTDYLQFNTKKKRDYINITPQVQTAVEKNGIQEGLCLVNAMHITASVHINDDESGLITDIDNKLEELAPHAPIDQYQHNRTGEQNADAHLKRKLVRARSSCGHHERPARFRAVGTDLLCGI